MKKIYFVLCFLFISTISLFSQISTDDPRVQLKVNAENFQYGVSVDRRGPNSSAGIGNWQYGMRTRSHFAGSYVSAGIYALAGSDDLQNSGRAYGVCATVGSSTSGYNYGVASTLETTQYGAAIVGSTSGIQYIPGRFAGYFVGDVKVLGNITGYTVTSSDKRLKKNIKNISTKSALDNIMLMNPVEYDLKQQYSNPVNHGDTAVNTAMYDENLQLFQKKHYGLIAQELQEIYPDLVYEDVEGYLSINYNGLIPILIESVKELKGEIEELKNITSIEQRNFSEVKEKAVLFQNNPNPFTQSTQIRYYIPQSVKDASIYIYDMQGKQLKKIKIQQRGDGYESVSGTEFAAGIYLYTLIADGKEIDTKRMILTQ